MDERAFHPDAPAGKAGKYARVERERRFLLPVVPSGEPVRRVLIEDRYVRGTRLRIRRMTDLDTAEGAVTYKFTQKIPTDFGGPGLITAGAPEEREEKGGDDEERPATHHPTE